MRKGLVTAATALLLGAGCREQSAATAPAPGANRASALAPAPAPVAADGGIAQEPPALLLRAAELAALQGDRGTARALLELALTAIARPQPGAAAIAVELGRGPIDLDYGPDWAEQSTADAVIAASGERLAIAHGRLLSVMELDGGYRLRRLARHPETLRRVVSDRTGQRFLTLSDDGRVRLLGGGGEPVLSWPLLSPGDPEQPGRPGREAVHRASWLDFSPDGRLVFLADCGRAATGDCPPRRLRVLTADRGELLQTLAVQEQELLDYTATRDGTLALLYAGRPPQLRSAETGGELPLRSALPRAETAACFSGTRLPDAGERPWVVSAERRWVATLVSPATACVWSLAERQLIATVALPARASEPRAAWRLESLLSGSFAPILVVSHLEPGSGRRGYLLDPQTGQRTAALAGLVGVVPLDDGGALLTGQAGARGGAGQRGSVQLLRLGPERRLQRIAGTERLVPPCMFAFPDAVQGDGSRALFSPAASSAAPDCPPALVEMSAAPARLLRLALAGRSPLVTADFIDEQRLVMVDGAGGVQVLRDANVEYASPQPAAALRRLRFSSPAGAAEPQLELETADGRTRALWLATGSLRAVPADNPAAAGAANAALPKAQTADGAMQVELQREARPQPRNAPAGSMPPAVLLREFPGGGIRWQAALRGLSAITALTFSPDHRAVLIGGTDGTVVWLRQTDGHELLRLQLIADKDAAVILTPDGRFDLLGEVAHPADYVFCRAGSYPIPFSLCTDRQRTAGLLSAVLAAQ